MNALNVRHSNVHSDIICHASGLTSARFMNVPDEPIQGVHAAELIAYHIPAKEETITEHNNHLDLLDK